VARVVPGGSRSAQFVDCPGSLRGSAPLFGGACSAAGRCYQQPAANVLSGRAQCLERREGLVLNATSLTSTTHHNSPLALRYDFHRAQYRSELLESGAAPVEVSIATHCDVEGFAHWLPTLAEHWRGPMVVAVSLVTRADVRLLSQVLKDPTLARCVALTTKNIIQSHGNQHRTSPCCW
jgi:hypothetical protein